MIRPPVPSDATELWRSVKASRTLDHNSFYVYWLLSSHFAQTSAVVEEGSRLIGFATGFRPPTDDSVLFVWQLRVESAARQRGIACSLILDILSRPVNHGISAVHATVSPSNDASRAVFRSIARKLDTSFSSTALLAASDFPAEAGVHEDEELVIVGPFDSSRVAAMG